MNRLNLWDAQFTVTPRGRLTVSAAVLTYDRVPFLRALPGVIRAELGHVALPDLRAEVVKSSLILGSDHLRMTLAPTAARGTPDAEMKFQYEVTGWFLLLETL